MPVGFGFHPGRTTVFRPETSPTQMPSRIASLDSVKIRATLEDLKPSVKGKDELELIAAAQSIADEINRVGTVTPTDQPDPSWRAELGQTFNNVGKAHSALGQADRLLAEAAK